MGLKKCMIIVAFCMIFLGGCGTSENKEDVAINYKNGVAEFSNEDYTFYEILNICNDALNDEYAISDDCTVSEMYVFTETDGKLLTSCDSEFEIVLQDNEVWYDITTIESMSKISIEKMDHSTGDENVNIPWNNLVSLAKSIDFSANAESDDSFIDISLTGLMDVPAETTIVQNENQRIFVLESNKLTQVDEEDVSGKYHGLILAYCSNDQNASINRDSGVNVNHTVGILLGTQ